MELKNTTGFGKIL